MTPQEQPACPTLRPWFLRPFSNKRSQAPWRDAGSRPEAENMQAKPGEACGARKQASAPNKSWGCIKDTQKPTQEPSMAKTGPI